MPTLDIADRRDPAGGRAGEQGRRAALPAKVKLWASIVFLACWAAIFIVFVAWRIKQDEQAAWTKRAEACAGFGLAGSELNQCAASSEALATVRQRAEDEAARNAFPTAVRERTNALHPLLAPHNSGHLLIGTHSYAPVDITSWCQGESVETVLGHRAELVGRRVELEAALFLSSVWVEDERVGYEISVAPVVPGGMDYSCPASIQQLPPTQRLALRNASCEPCGVKVWGTLKLVEASFWNPDEFRLGVDIEGLDIWPPS
jgi:hypothetical protein